MSNQETSGYSSLRIGFILVSLAEIVLFASIIITVSAISHVIYKYNTTNISHISLSQLESAIPPIVGWIEILGIIIGIISSIFLYIGFNKEKGIYNLGSATTGPILVLIGFIFYALPFVSILGVIIGIIGFILMKGALDSIGNKYNENLVNNGAILSIIPIISIIGTLIAALGLTKVINKAKSGQIAISQPLPSVSQPIQQIGLGVIKDNGEISLTLYSQVQGTIISVRIEGTSYFSTLSIPLQIGNNNIIINLGMPISLVKSTTYKITLMVSTPSGTIPITVDALYNP